MSKFVIFGDSTCDMIADLRKQYDVDYVPMNYVVDDEEYVASLDWESHSYKEFYDFMRNGKRITTTQVPQNAYYEKFKPLAEQGIDVLYISCSSALSGSVNIARKVAEQIKEECPNANIYCVDSLISSLGQAHIIITAAACRDEGLSAAQTVEKLEAMRLTVNQFGTVGSLEYLRRAGRIKASKAFFGNLFGVKPIIISDIIGQNYAYKKVKGAANARRDIAQSIVDAAQGNYDTLYLSHADCIEELEALRDEILKLADFKKVIIGVVGPIVGASVGPGTIIAYVAGKEVTIEGRE